jgi:hypothetical protein
VWDYYLPPDPDQPVLFRDGLHGLRVVQAEDDDSRRSLLRGGDGMSATEDMREASRMLRERRESMGLGWSVARDRETRLRMINSPLSRTHKTTGETS